MTALTDDAVTIGPYVTDHMLIEPYHPRPNAPKLRSFILLYHPVYSKTLYKHACSIIRNLF